MAAVTSLPTVKILIVTPALCRILEALLEDSAPEHVVTSITDGIHTHHSAHYRGEAVDVRTRDLSADDAAAVRDRLAAALGPRFTVLLEQPGATPATSAQHLHVQLAIGATWAPTAAA